MNFTCMNLSRGIVDKNGKWNGLLGKLGDGKCDLVMGGFYPDNEVLTHFWVSNTYMEDVHTWFVKLADPRPTWKALAAIFNNELWLCFLMALFIAWVSWYFFIKTLPEPRTSQDLLLTAINAMAVSIAVAVYERPLHFAPRIFFCGLALYGLNIMAIYTSRLILVFKDPGHLYQLKTIEEIHEAGVPFGGNSENKDWFENEEDDWIYENYNESEVFEPNEVNFAGVAKGERVILGGRMFMQQSNISDFIYPLERKVFSSPLQFFMTYGAPFQNELSTVVLYCNDFGIVGKILSEFTYNNSYLDRIAKDRPEFTEKAIILTLEHFEGPFAILIIGLLTSTLLFLGELQVHCLKTRLLIHSTVGQTKLKESEHKYKGKQFKMRKRKTKSNKLYKKQSQVKKMKKIIQKSRKHLKMDTVKKSWFY